MTMKTCQKCKQEKPVAEFHRHSGRRDGLSAKCKACVHAYDQNRYAGQRDRFLEARRAWVRRVGVEVARRSTRKAQMKRTYGITLDDYDKMVADRGGACDICGCVPTEDTHKKSLCVDHDHETGEIRGLLCSACNAAIGLFKDDPAVLSKAIAYLKGARHG